MSGRAALLAFAVAATVLLIPAPGARAAFPGPATSGDFAGLVTIPDGRRLYLECHGIGTPTVVFDSGLRSRGDFWTLSAQGPGTGPYALVAGSTRACFYDRPGTLLGLGNPSRSDPVPMPRTTGAAALDLHELLTAAGVPGPYVLVGGSTGGLIARQYAAYYPAEVAGLVLVDAISEAVQSGMKPKQFARYNHRYLQSPGFESRQYPYLEYVDFYRSFAEIRHKPRPPRRIPILVISNQLGFDQPNGVTAGFARLVNRVWNRAQRYLASLEPGIPHVIASGSGHQISASRPGLVARMVLRVVDAVRTGRPLKRHG
jgi:pimeloyl-ACP methyl ester carboxylesterase